MLNNTTISKLHEMKMSVMAQAFREHLEDPRLAELSFEERVGLMVDAEWMSRRNNRLGRLIKNADFPFYDACVEDIEYHADRELDKAQITRLAACMKLHSGSAQYHSAWRYRKRENLALQCPRHGRMPELLSGSLCPAPRSSGGAGYRTGRRFLPQDHEALQTSQIADSGRMAPISSQGN